MKEETPSIPIELVIARAPGHCDPTSLVLAHGFLFLQLTRQPNNRSLKAVFDHVIEPLCLPWSVDPESIVTTMTIQIPRDVSLDAIEEVWSSLLEMDQANNNAYIMAFYLMSVVLDAYQREIEGERLPGNPADIEIADPSVFGEKCITDYMLYRKKASRSLQAEALAQIAAKHFFVPCENASPPGRFLDLARTVCASVQ
jgi:hypothetical protein